MPVQRGLVSQSRSILEGRGRSLCSVLLKNCICLGRVQVAVRCRRCFVVAANLRPDRLTAGAPEEQVARLVTTRPTAIRPDSSLAVLLSGDSERGALLCADVSAVVVAARVGVAGCERLRSA